MYLLLLRVEHEGNKNCKKEGKENYHMNNLRTKVGNKRNGKMETKGTLQKRENGWGSIMIEEISKGNLISGRN